MKLIARKLKSATQRPQRSKDALLWFSHVFGYASACVIWVVNARDCMYPVHQMQEKSDSDYDDKENASGCGLRIRPNATTGIRLRNLRVIRNRDRELGSLSCHLLSQTSQSTESIVQVS